MTRCECDRAEIDNYGDQCWQCFVQADVARHERSIVSIADMRRRVDSEYTTADNVESFDPIESVPDPIESDTAVMVSYVWACSGRFTQEYGRIAA
jgi:hypothetical protein